MPGTRQVMRGADNRPMKDHTWEDCFDRAKQLQEPHWAHKERSDSKGVCFTWSGDLGGSYLARASGTTYACRGDTEDWDNWVKVQFNKFETDYS